MKISLRQTKIAGLEGFRYIEGMSKEENEEMCLRNNIISAIQQSWIDREGMGREPLYFPLVKIINPNPQAVAIQIKRYFGLKKEFIKKGYEGIEVYDKFMKSAIENLPKIGLENKSFLEALN